MIGVLSQGIASIPHLDALLREPWAQVGWWRPRAPRVDKVAGWGLRATAQRARQWADTRGLPYVSLEDGFLRSVGLGHQDPPLSIVVGGAVSHLDASAPSLLEQFIRAEKSVSQLQRAEHLIQAWCRAGVSKYNHARTGPALNEGRPYVLVADQSGGDPSIRAGQANSATFLTMLEAALDEHPNERVVLKVHPDVLARGKRGHFESLTRGQAARVIVLADDVHPAGVIEHASAVYTVTSQIGFEALMWGKPVRTFGMPFYAGWGLTQDHLLRPDRRNAPVSLGDLVHGCLVDYMRCIDPESGSSCPVERVISHLALQRRQRERFPAQLHAIGFSYWKRPIMRAFFAGSQVTFVKQPKDAPAAATLVAWGVNHLEQLQGKPVIRVEDGFLRSVGLGANLVRPLSLSADCTGVHCDSTRPNDLETLLATAHFDSALIQRASCLRDQIVHHGVTKYGVRKSNARGDEFAWARADHPRVILVPGQVESDASIRHGSPTVKSNLELLRAVRRSAPDAFVVYKPHPDVLAGHRPAGADEDQAHRYCDVIVQDACVSALFEVVDEVHVMTSLAGFEALARGLKVVTYGCPFYAGWGLTTDIEPMSRRARKLGLDELIAGSLILYPTYVSSVTGRFTTPERIVTELVRRGLDDAASPLLWNLSAPKVLKRQINRALAGVWRRVGHNA